MDRLKSPLRIVNTLALLVIAYALLAEPSVAAPNQGPLAVPLGPAFTFEGKLGTLTGSYDFQFRLFDAPAGGILLLPMVATVSNVTVDKGKYVVMLNFGENIMSVVTGQAIYLEVKYRVHTTSTSAPYTLLTGNRPQLPTVPYALSMRGGSTVKGATTSPALTARNNGTGPGFLGVGIGSDGVRGSSTSGNGVIGVTQAASTSSIAGVYGKSTGDGGVGVIGEAPTGNSYGVYGITNGGSGVYGQATTGAAVVGSNIYGGIAMKANGSAVQTAYQGGWAKALVRIQGDGTFVSCYNGVTGSSSGGCGFTVAAQGGGVYNIDFGSGIDTQYRFFALSGSSSIILTGFPSTDTVQVAVGNAAYGYAYYILVY